MQRSNPHKQSHTAINSLMLQAQAQQAPLRKGNEVLKAGSAWDTGYEELNQYLPNGGWSKGKLSEFLCVQQGIGELQLLLPALKSISQKQWVIFINPPQLPYGPALVQQGLNLDHCLVINSPEAKDQLWSMEQALLSDSCGAVLCWPTQALPKHIRRLQVAAGQGQALGFLYRSLEHLNQASAANLRLQLSRSFIEDNSKTSQQNIDIEIIKRPNGWPVPPFTLETCHFNQEIAEQYKNQSPENSPEQTQAPQTEIASIDLLNPLTAQQPPLKTQTPISNASIKAPKVKAPRL